MIIKFPTGFYETILPKVPEDSGNITFTISNNEPPRTNLVFPKIPPGIVDRKRSPKTINIFDRRDIIGDLVFKISQSTRKDEGNNEREFEIGQVLEFSDAPLKELDPMFIGATTTTQHDVNRLNYDALGVTEDEQQLIADASLVVHQGLSDQLNIVRQQRADAEQQVIGNQKIINDTDRTIRALTVIQDSTTATSSDVDELIVKLEAKRQEAFVLRDQATESANDFAAQASDLVDEIRTVGVVLI